MQSKILFLNAFLRKKNRFMQQRLSYKK